jgi:hypothetical protein
MNDNTYKIHVIYDNETPKVFELSTEYVAYSMYNNLCIDLGLAKVVATYNLVLPSGKMFTKHYNASGFIGGK